MTSCFFELEIFFLLLSCDVIYERRLCINNQKMDGDRHCWDSIGRIWEDTEPYSTKGPERTKIGENYNFSLLLSLDSTSCPMSPPKVTCQAIWEKFCLYRRFAPIFPKSFLRLVSSTSWNRKPLRVFVTQKLSRYQKKIFFFEKVENYQNKRLGGLCVSIWHISTSWLQDHCWKTAKFWISAQYFKVCLKGANTHPKPFLGRFGNVSCIRKPFLAYRFPKIQILAISGPKWGMCRNFYPHFGACGQVPGVLTYLIRRGGLY